MSGKRILRLMVILFFGSALTLAAQPGKMKYHTKSAKAIKKFEDSQRYIDGKQYSVAEAMLLEAIETDSGFIEAHLVLAEVYSYMGRKGDAIERYKKVVSMDPKFYPRAYYFMGDLQMQWGNYREAIKSFQSFLGLSKSPEMDKVIQRKLKQCYFADSLVQHPVPFKPVNMGENVNSPFAEYLPAVTADEQTIFFTLRKETEFRSAVTNSKYEEDIVYAEKKEGKWGKTQGVGDAVNTADNEGALCISADGQTMFFTAIDRPDGYGSADIYIVKRIGNQWTKPQNLGPPVNTKSFESQPSISSDGKTLYFISSRGGGLGNLDIWKSELQPNGTWGTPVNLGNKINTNRGEQSPFIHPDNKTLYFTSEGHMGMGDYDIFYSRLDENGEWGEAINLGYPINSPGNERGLVVSANGAIAYFSSEQSGGIGKQDIYWFEMPVHLRPTPVGYVKGKVMDAVTRQPMEVRMELIDLQTAKIIMETQSNKGNGEYLLCLPAGKDYAFNVSPQGYLIYSENFSLRSQADSVRPYQMDISLKPIKAGDVFPLKNIFFDTDKWSLKDESKAELQKLLAFLNANPAVKIEVGGHTDNTGGQQHNLTLSANRARSVYDFLIAGGIPAARLTHRGYGDSKPIAGNDTEEGKAKNRRTEIKVLGN